jgi:internalin A
LHQLGVILHFKDRIGLKNIVILKPKWATEAFYSILSTKSVRNREGVLLHSELEHIWDKETYPSEIYPQLMELMNKFELAYELSDKSKYLVPELLPSYAFNFTWDEKDNLCFYYCYDYFLPPGIITRFIVRMHQDIEIKENGLPLCWREGAVLKLQNSLAYVKMNPHEKQIEIRIKGTNKREALAVICHCLDQINSDIKKLNIIKKVPCNCSENCPQRYFYEELLEAEKANIKNIQCHKSYTNMSISLLLDGYKRRDERGKEEDEFSGRGPVFVISPTVQAYSQTNPTIQVEQKTNVRTSVNVNLEVELPQIQIEFDNLKEEVQHLDPKLEHELDKIQDSLDEISASSEKETLKKPLNKLYRCLIKLSDPNSNYNKVIAGTQKGIEYAQKLGRTYNKFAQWLAMPQVPDLFLGKS